MFLKRNVGLILSFASGFLIGLLRCKNRKLPTYALLAILISLTIFFAWCSVYPQKPPAYPPHNFADAVNLYLANFLGSVRLLASWPFWIGRPPLIFIPERDMLVLYFLGHPIIDRHWVLGSMLKRDWRYMVLQEFFAYLAIINVLAGISGFLISLEIVSSYSQRRNKDKHKSCRESAT